MNEQQMTYYDLLGVSIYATTEEIKAAYRKMSWDMHPDRHPDDPHLAKRWQVIGGVYSTLKDPIERAAYDQKMRLSTPGVTEEQGSAASSGSAAADDLRNAFDALRRAEKLREKQKEEQRKKDEKERQQAAQEHARQEEQCRAAAERRRVEEEQRQQKNKGTIYEDDVLFKFYKCDDPVFERNFKEWYYRMAENDYRKGRDKNLQKRWKMCGTKSERKEEKGRRKR